MPAFDEAYQEILAEERGKQLLNPFAEAYEGARASPGQPSLLPGEFEPGVERTLPESILDFLSDQLEPLNLAMLAVSFYTGPALAGLIKPLAAAGPTLARTGIRALESTAGRRLAHRFLFGLGVNLPFAAGELLEEPPEGSTRMDQFTRSLGVLTLFDAALLMPLGGAANRLIPGRARKLALQRTHEATQATVAAGIAAIRERTPATTLDDAATLVFTDLLQQRADQLSATFGPDRAAELLSTAEQLARAEPRSLLAAGLGKAFVDLSERPEVMQGLKNLGLDETALLQLPELLNRELATSTAERAVASAQAAAIEAAQGATDMAAAPAILRKLRKATLRTPEYTIFKDPSISPRLVLESAAVAGLPEAEQRAIRTWAESIFQVRGETMGPAFTGRGMGELIPAELTPELTPTPFTPKDFPFVGGFMGSARRELIPEPYGPGDFPKVGSQYGSVPQGFKPRGERKPKVEIPPAAKSTPFAKTVEEMVNSAPTRAQTPPPRPPAAPPRPAVPTAKPKGPAAGQRAAFATLEAHGATLKEPPVQVPVGPAGASLRRMQAPLKAPLNAIAGASERSRIIDTARRSAFAALGLKFGGARAIQVNDFFTSVAKRMASRGETLEQAIRAAPKPTTLQREAAAAVLKGGWLPQ